MANKHSVSPFRVQSADELSKAFEEAFKSEVPVLIHVPVDYSQNQCLMQSVIQSFVN